MELSNGLYGLFSGDMEYTTNNKKRLFEEATYVLLNFELFEM